MEGLGLREGSGFPVLCGTEGLGIATCLLKATVLGDPSSFGTGGIRGIRPISKGRGTKFFFFFFFGSGLSGTCISRPSNSSCFNFGLSAYC